MDLDRCLNNGFCISLSEGTTNSGMGLLLSVNVLIRAYTQIYLQLASSL